MKSNANISSKKITIMRRMKLKEGAFENVFVIGYWSDQIIVFQIMPHISALVSPNIFRCEIFQKKKKTFIKKNLINLPFVRPRERKRHVLASQFRKPSLNI